MVGCSARGSVRTVVHPRINKWTVRFGMNVYFGTTHIVLVQFHVFIRMFCGDWS